MAQRKKRKARKGKMKRKSAAMKSRPKRKAAKAKARRAAPKRKARRAAPKRPAVEQVVVDTVEEPVPGVVVVTEYETTLRRGPFAPSDED